MDEASISLSMAVIGAIRRRLLLLAQSERGMAAPVALFALIASFALASAAVLSSVDVQRGSARDHDAKEAIAAADAGANLALLRLNRFQKLLTPATPCVSPAGVPESADPAHPGWCRPTATEGVSEGSEFVYRVSAFNGSGTLTVVSTGTSETVSRRVEVGLFSHNGKNVFADEKLIGQDDITLKGSVNVRTDIGTNGDVTLVNENGKEAILCGNVRHGLGKKAPTPTCGKEKLEGEKDLPPITPPEDFSSNCRLSVTCTIKSEVDTFSKVTGKKVTEAARTATVPWDAAHETINIPTNNSRLSMGGRDYHVCGLFVNGELIMNAGSEIRIFVDTPENCGLAPGATQVEFTASSTIVSTGFNPEQGTFTVPQIYVLGDSTVKLSGNAGVNELMLYAPLSYIDMQGSATYKGMIAGRSVYVHGNPTIESDSNIKEPDIALASLLERTHFVECMGGVGVTPDANC